MTMDPTTTSAAGIDIATAVKAYLLKPIIGMIGAALLYTALPPVKADGSFDRTEFVIRLAAAGIFSHIFGDWAVDILSDLTWLHAADHKAAVYLVVGAPGWWVTRAVALWLRRRENKDIGEVIKEVKEST